MKSLIVGGSWNNDGGKPSGLIKKMYEELKNIDDKSDIKFINGGYYNELESIIKTAKEYDVIYWMTHVPNELPKVRDVKNINPHAIVVGSKRNDNNKYSFVEILNRSLLQRNNLTIEFKKTNDKFNMLVFDPLGTTWYDGDNLKEMVNSLHNRISFILTTKREHTYKAEGELYIPDEKYFFDYLRYCSDIFQKTIEHAPGVTRFLGNGSFRNDKGDIYVTQRDVDKSLIDEHHFVNVYKEDDKVYYLGDYKPSKDTIVQVNLYEKLKNINYIIHSHCYVKDAPYTGVPVPCGALDEIDEVINVIKKYYDNNYELNYYAINLIGHGCLIMGKDVNVLKNTKFITRHLPEYLD